MRIKIMKGCGKMNLKVRDKRQEWKMKILKDWEKSYNSILNGSFKGAPAEKVFNEIYNDVFIERRWKDNI